jgi:hypothetical protein
MYIYTYIYIYIYTYTYIHIYTHTHLVFSSASLSVARDSKGMQQDREGYNSSQWNAALPTAKHANFLVLASSSAQHAVRRDRGELEEKEDRGDVS